MHMSLRGYLTALVGDLQGDPRGRRIADDLQAVVRLISRTNDLAVVLTDFAVPRSARRAVLEELLSDRVDPVALRLLLQTVETERADELPTSLHELFESALHLYEIGAAQVLATEPISTRGDWRRFAAGYATAIFEDLHVAELEETEDALFRFARIVAASPPLRSALSDSSRAVADREQLLRELLTGKVSEATLRILMLPFQGRVRDFVGATDWLSEQAARARGWRVAVAHTARPIDEDERRELSEQLKRLIGHPAELHVLEDPDLIGGAVIEVGDLVVDASARHRLDSLEEHLLGHGQNTGAQN